MLVQIRAKTAISRGLFTGIRQCRETTALRAADYVHLSPDRTKRPVTTLTRQVLARHRGVHYTPFKRRKSAFTLAYRRLTSTWRCIHSPIEARTVKLTFAISVVALVLIAGTTTICLSGAVTDRTTEYGSARATFDQMFSSHQKICR
ncbi:hypothetical protein DIE02_20865 [Burkholderia sp. Bp8991]|nr:hypothetical protein DIE02_20865 [Burkholderia sp. Bp8991]